MYHKLDSCPLCNNSTFENQRICEDQLVTGESFAIVRCNQCNFLFTNPRPTEEKLPKYYDSTAYVSHANKANSAINLIYKIVRSYTLRQKVKLINRLNTQKTLLDFGCGTGDFLLKAHENGWTTYGIEPSENARKEVNKKIPKALIDTPKQLPATVDIITAWHVIEHVPDLLPTVRELAKHLDTGGYFILALPNHKSFDASHYGSNWAAYDVPRHLYHFDQHSLETLAAKLKMRVHSILPMKFDSYYVSLLSEKSLPKSSTISAIINGWRSNQMASKTGEYSSLIYILQK